MSNKTIADHLSGVKASRESALKRMNDIVQKTVDEGRSMNDAEQAEFDACEVEVKNLEGDIARYSRLQSSQAESAKSVQDLANDNAKRPANSAGVPIANVKKNEKLEPGIGFARLARVKAISFVEHVDPAQVAKHLYPDDSRLNLALGQKAAVPAANTGSPTWAGDLILDRGAYFGDFVEYLRSQSVVGKISDRLRNLPFDTPVLVQGTGGRGRWTQEGHAKPLTKWSYTKTKLSPLKVTAVAAATKEMLSRSSAAAETLIRDELTRSTLAEIDGTFVSASAAVTDESPAGIRNGVSALTLNGDGTVAGVRCDIAQFLKELVGDNLSVAGAFWVMPETVAIDLSMATNEVGVSAFPGMTPTGGTLAGLPAFASQYVAPNVVMLIKGDEIFLGDEGGVEVKVSDQASLIMDDAPDNNSTEPTGTSVVSMWQTNSVAFLVERFINWQKRRASAVVWATVNWDACGS